MIQAKAFVLRTYKHGEAHLMVHLLTEGGEKLKLHAPSALKSKKRFGGGVLEPTHCLHIQYRESKREDGLGTLLEAKLSRGFEGLRTDFDRLQLGLHFIRLIDHIAQEGEEHSSFLFHLLGHGLKQAEQAENLEVLKLHFELRMLNSQGVLAPDQSLEDFLRIPLSESQNLNIQNIKKAQSLCQNSLKNYLSHVSL